MGDALRDFFPCELALGAEEFGCVFDDKHVPGLPARQFKSRAGDGKMHIAAMEMEFDFEWRPRPCAGRGG